jgi:hypothetical protein
MSIIAYAIVHAIPVAACHGAAAPQAAPAFASFRQDLEKLGEKFLKPRSDHAQNS